MTDEQLKISPPLGPKGSARTPHGSIPLEMRTDEEVVMELLLLSTRRRRGRRGLNGISLTLYYELRRL